MQKFLPALFHVLLAAGPVLIAIAQHNYTEAASGAYSLFASLLATLGVGGLGVASMVGAAVVHSKTVSKAAATLPDVPASQESNRDDLLRLMWQEMGPGASAEEVKAFQDFKKSKAAPETMKPRHSLLLCAVLLAGCLQKADTSKPADVPTPSVNASVDQKALYALFAKAVREGEWNDTDSLMAAFKKTRELSDIPSDPATIRVTFPEFETKQPIDAKLRESIAARFDKLAK